MSDTLAELSLPQNYDSTFLELKQREEQKTIHVNHSNRENYNKPFTKEELTRAIHATKNFAPCPDKIHNEMLKTPSCRRIRLSPFYVQQNMAARILP